MSNAPNASEMIDQITLEMVQDDWNCCYSDDHIKSLFDKSYTPIEVLTNRDDIWRDVPIADRFWVVLRQNILPDELMRLFGCWSAEQILEKFENEMPGDTRPRNTIEVSRRFAFGKVTMKELADASPAGPASSPEWHVEFTRVFGKTPPAAWEAARSSSWVTTGESDLAAQRASEAAARSTTRSARSVRTAQLSKLIEMVTIWQETGDIFGGETMNPERIEE